MSTNNEDCKKLTKAVLEWWKYHQHDTTGECGEYNVYDETPKFVSIAEKLQHNLPGSLKPVLLDPYEEDIDDDLGFLPDQSRSDNHQ